MPRPRDRYNSRKRIFMIYANANALLTQEIQELKHMIELCESRERDLDRRGKELVQTWTQLDNVDRRCNIKIAGVAETTNDSPSEIAIDILSKIVPELTESALGEAYRFGRPGTQERPIKDATLIR